jgi:hypothetical protein
MGLDPTYVVCSDLRQFSGSKIHIGTGLQLFAKYSEISYKRTPAVTTFLSA